MGAVLDLAEQYWTGEISTVDVHPFTELRGLEELTDDLAFVSSFANVTALRTDEGLLLVDTGNFLLATHLHAQIRAWTDAPVCKAVYTHGHVDHVFGLGPFEQEARDRNQPAPEVIAHEAVSARFDRYVLTSGYNGVINARQFGMQSLDWPTDYRHPDRTYQDALELQVGDQRVQLFHDRGETDDHTWVWLPDRRTLCAGDLFIWAAPNCGNPQKAQRYPREWAAALRKMAALEPEQLLPGHGPPIVGHDRVQLALTETAELLETLVEQTLRLMNEGATLDDVLHTVKAPDRLLQRPYLRPVYDEPCFIVRNLWRQYGGWYDGNPAHLKPAPDAQLAAELTRLSGGADVLSKRAADLSEQGDHALACHLVELASRASAAPGVWEIRRAVYRARAKHEVSLMAKGIYNDAADRAPPAEDRGDASND